MQKELLDYIKTHSLFPFRSARTSIRSQNNTIFKTADARAVHTKTISKISSSFSFADTETLWNCFPFAKTKEEIDKRQKFFKSVPALLQGTSHEFLKEIRPPKPIWKPRYGIIVVTEDENAYLRLKELACPVKLLIGEQDLLSLDSHDIVQVVECEQFTSPLEQLPQSVFLDSVEDAYLERNLITLSGWKEILKNLASQKTLPEIAEIVNKLSPLLMLVEGEKREKISIEQAQEAVEKINENIAQKMQNLTLGGDVLFSLLHQGTLPAQFQDIVRKSISENTLPSFLFNETMPVTLNEEETDRFIKEQNAEEHTGTAEKIKRQSGILRKVPELVSLLSSYLIFFDFLSGVNEFMLSANSFPIVSEELSFSDSENAFLISPQPISFSLSDGQRCSILTGANSGGKTTLLEHVIQLISIMHLGLPVKGNVKFPIFSDIYYFAKNKGSSNKGAFETLLSQLSSIEAGRQTLILADEIESVTEPGVAGKVVCATAEYFLKKGCFLIIATHLGQEIQKALPIGARIDGIEAKGLTEQFELIVDHNPVLGRLAHSTPELIIERLARTNESAYFQHIYSYLRAAKN